MSEDSDLARLGEGLVTLKELPLSERDKKILSLIAVKWVKICNHGKCLTYPMGSKRRCRRCRHFMNFFNLTEEDLK